MHIGIVGCGFVADYYMSTLQLHPELVLTGVMDLDTERAVNFSQYYNVPRYESIEALLDDPRVKIVLNLTNPRSHFDISKAALMAGKHVYSEKPLGMTIDEAKELVELAENNGLLITSAPCSLLSETAQTIWKALRDKVVGHVRIVYAEMDDGMLHLMPYQKWENNRGLPWPYKDEFEIGCTLEHAGYSITWLIAFFGPAITITSFSSVQVQHKLKHESLNMVSPDFTVSCIEFESGVVARLTCSVLAPPDHSLKIIGDNGVLYTNDSWHYYASVFSRKIINIRRRTLLNPIRKRHQLLKSNIKKVPSRGSHQMDFSRGVAELASAIREKRPCRLSPKFALHANEIALAIHYTKENNSTYLMSTTFDPIDPMDWAK